MPSSISYSSILPKFPDKQRRPGIIQLPQALSTRPAVTAVKQSAHNGLSKQSQNAPDAVLKALPTPSPSPASRSKSSSQQAAAAAQAQAPHQQSRRKQKRSSLGNIVLNVGDDNASSGVKAVAPSSVVVPSGASATPGPVLLSPPPTPAQRANKKASSRKSKSNKTASGHARQSSKSLPISPPLTPEAFKFPPVAVEEAVFAPLLPPIKLAQDMAQSDDSLPLADEDEVIVWKQPQTPTFALPAPKQRALSTPSRTPSPTESFKWEDVKNLPRLSPATVAQLKEQYDIRPSEAFQTTESSRHEPDLLMSLLHSSSSSSCPPTPGASPDHVYATPSKPIAIGRRPNGASHVRAPSFPAYPPSGRLAMMQYKEDVAEAFGLDVRDELAVQKATEAWRAYAGSTFNNSPETERVPPPKFLGRLFL